MKIGTVPSLVFWHLFPGFMGLAAYLLLTPLLVTFGIPSLLVLQLVLILIIVPVEILVLSNQRGFSMLECMENFTLKRTDLFFWVFLLVLYSTVVMVLSESLIDSHVRQKFFSWLPAWYFCCEDTAAYGTTIRLFSFIVLVCSQLTAAVVEEIYFRGWLLNKFRKDTSGVFGGSFLFSLYHFDSLWQIVSRFLAVLPALYLVRKYKDIRLVIFWHFIINFLGILMTAKILLL